MTTFRLTRLPGSGKGRKGVGPKPAATCAEIRAAIASSFITPAEARGIALFALCRPSQWSKPPDHADKRLYRAAKPSEDRDLAEGVNVLPDPL
jgi:hypothetical protein